MTGGPKTPPLVIFPLESDLAVSTDTSKCTKAQKEITGEGFKRKPKTRRKKNKMEGKAGNRTKPKPLEADISGSKLR